MFDTGAQQRKSASLRSPGAVHFEPSVQLARRLKAHQMQPVLQIQIERWFTRFDNASALSRRSL